MNHVLRFPYLLALCAILSAPALLIAQTLSVTVTPPLFQLTIGPGESWSSTVKVVNNNAYDVTYFATPMDFEAQGEKGTGRFIPIVQGDETFTLANWIEIASEPVTIRKGSSGEIPFSVRIPENAAPGGHYAAILVGTEAADDVIEGPAMKVSSFVSSLLFVRIKGEVLEEGRIREFISDRALYETPHANFSLRFENTGNTHLKPQGDITIYNMWGKERGKVAINQERNFGNVLPNSVRKFEFSWEGERSVFDIGRYRAVATLAYGQEAQQTAVASAYFWVVPVIPVAATVGTVLFFLLLLAWLIRRYIRRALALERARYGITPQETTPAPTPTIEMLMTPIREGVVDLRSVSRGGDEVAGTAATPVHRTEQLTAFGFLQKYSLFFFFIAVLVAGALFVWTYLDTVLIPEKSYEIRDIFTEDEAIKDAE